MHAKSFSWPTKEDYDMAMESFNENVIDPDLKQGVVKTDRAGMHRFGGAGLYTTLYRVDNMMIRCFCKTPQREPPNDIVMRYWHISAFTQRMQHVPNLVPVTLVERGIRVAYLDHDTYVQTGIEDVPFVKMPFIRGKSLGSFIFSNLNKQESMEKLCVVWLQLIRNLDHITMAHGDLDLTNVIVTEDRNANLTLKLIDYDNMWIPELAIEYEQTEGGHEHFQHPAFSRKRLFNAEMDRFSALVIYISLKALTHSPDLYVELGADDTNRLLLGKADYVAEMNGLSGRIELLRNKQIPQLQPFLDELCSCLQSKSMPCRLKDLMQHDPSEDAESVHIPDVSSQSQTLIMIDDATYEVVYDAWDRVKWKEVPKIPDHVRVQPRVQRPNLTPSNQSEADQQQAANIGVGTDQQQQAQIMKSRGGYRLRRQSPYPRPLRPSVNWFMIGGMILAVVIFLSLLALGLYLAGWL